jgi:hypothetical protein
VTFPRLFLILSITFLLVNTPHGGVAPCLKSLLAQMTLPTSLTSDGRL